LANGQSSKWSDEMNLNESNIELPNRIGCAKKSVCNFWWNQVKKDEEEAQSQRRQTERREGNNKKKL